MGLSNHYRSVTGNVRTPGPKDPVEINQQGNTTSMEFGLDAQEAFGQLPAPVTQSELGAEAWLKLMGRIPDMPRDLMRMNSQQRQKIGYEPSMSIGDLRMMDEQAMSAKSPDTYGTNRGGFGGAGRGQFGKSQFDVQTDAPPDMSIGDLRKLDDKPWELDDNTNADVQSGVSLTPKPEENIVDKEPDLQTPQGLYQALAKKYPDILTQNLDQLQKSRVTEEELEGLSDRAGLGSLFIAASKAASGAGSIGGKTAESIAPTIVNREDTLARQRLKDRMDVASENMSMNAKAVDLAMKQIDFTDEREQYDPNSDVSQFARDFMKQEFGVDVPNSVPAYQLKQFLPAVVQKYQAQERAKYQNAVLGQKTDDSLLNDAYRRYQTATQSGDKQAQIEAQKTIAELKAMSKGPGGEKTPKPEKMRGSVPKEQADAEIKMKNDFRTEKVVQTYELANSAFNVIKENYNLPDAQKTTYTDMNMLQQYAKLLDPTSVVREQEFETVKKLGGFFTQWANAKAVFLGEAQLQPAQRAQLMQAAENVMKGQAVQYDKKAGEYRKMADRYQLSSDLFEFSPYSAGAKPSGQTKGKSGLTSEQRKKRIEQLKAAEGGN